MPVLDVIYEKLECNRHTPAKGPGTDGIKVNSNSRITEIKKNKLPNLGDVLEISFEYTTEYIPDIGNIIVEGKVLYHDKDLKQKIEDNKDGVKITDKTAFEEVNTVILRNATIQSLLLSKEMKLPAPIQLPSIKVQQPSSGGKKGYA